MSRYFDGSIVTFDLISFLFSDEDLRSDLCLCNIDKNKVSISVLA